MKYSKISKKAIVLAIGATLVAPMAHADVDLFGKAVQVYGQLRGSVDLYDRGTATATVADPSGIEITSNASRLGFKGEKELSGGIKGLWKFESEIDITGETGTLAARDRFVGIGGSGGNVLIGIHDTPLKLVGSRYTLFGDTLGDRRGILGQVSTGGDNQFNQRAKSMIMYQYQGDAFSASAIYSPEFENSSASSTEPDSGNTGTRETLTGFGLNFKNGGIDVGLAYEKQENIDNTLGKDANGMRLGIKYKTGNLQVGGVLEDLKDKGYGARIARKAFGINASYKVGNYILAGQYLKAEESDLTGGNDGADQLTIGVYYNLDKDMQVYAMHSSLGNDSNAAYQLARSGAGQRFAPTQNGETVSATSVGLIYKF